MLKRQRRKFEMFLRVRDFYNARTADFAKISVGEQLFAALLLIIEQLEQLGASAISVTGNVAQAIDVKGDAKDLLKDMLRDIADMAETMAYEFSGLESKFRMPRNKSVQNLILAGRAFAADAVQYKNDFVRYGFNEDFISDLTAATDALEAAHSSTDTHTQERVGTNAALVPLFKDGTEKINRLQPLVKMRYRADAANLSAWIFASHLEREPKPEKPKPAV